MVVNVYGINLNEEDIRTCFVNIITRLSVDNFKKAIFDIRAVEKALGFEEKELTGD